MLLQGSANGHALYQPAPMAAAQQLPWLPSVSGAPGAAGYGLPPPAADAGQLQGGYEAQLVAHIMACINNLWRVDPGSFPATLSSICAQSPRAHAAPGRAPGGQRRRRRRGVACSGRVAEPAGAGGKQRSCISCQSTVRALAGGKLTHSVMQRVACIL